MSSMNSVFIVCINRCLNQPTHYLLFRRAEKEKSQYFGELTDLRAGVDHLANEKV